ncbi:hypothetical protein HBJ16_002543 [Pseudomonas sp. CES]|nr:hypothetical protein HBJ16_002543 [Pseudomonas sp. CES]
MPAKKPTRWMTGSAGVRGRARSHKELASSGLLPYQQQFTATICLFFLQLPLYPPRRKLNRFIETILSPYSLRGPPFDAPAVYSIIKR